MKRTHLLRLQRSNRWRSLAAARLGAWALLFGGMVGCRDFDEGSDDDASRHVSDGAGGAEAEGASGSGGEGSAQNGGEMEDAAGGSSGGRSTSGGGQATASSASGSNSAGGSVAEGGRSGAAVGDSDGIAGAGGETTELGSGGETSVGGSSPLGGAPSLDGGSAPGPLPTCAPQLDMTFDAAPSSEPHWPHAEHTYVPMLNAWATTWRQGDEIYMDQSWLQYAPEPTLIEFETEPIGLPLMLCFESSGRARAVAVAHSDPAEVSFVYYDDSPLVSHHTVGPVAVSSGTGSFQLIGAEANSSASLSVLIGHDGAGLVQLMILDGHGVVFGPVDVAPNVDEAAVGWLEEIDRILLFSTASDGATLRVYKRDGELESTTPVELPETTVMVPGSLRVESLDTEIALVWEEPGGAKQLAVLGMDGSFRLAPLGNVGADRIAAQGDVLALSWVEGDELWFTQHRVTDGSALTDPFMVSDSLAHAHHAMAHRSNWPHYGLIYSYDLGDGEYVLRFMNIECPYAY